MYTKIDIPNIVTKIYETNFKTNDSMFNDLDAFDVDINACYLMCNRIMNGEVFKKGAPELYIELGKPMLFDDETLFEDWTKDEVLASLFAYYTENGNV